ncbi:hypothetical protein RQP50_20740 [Paenibacillus sp. chi10]|uniref:Uncharacterized protein n=1 Tax=Paenibacillus suaedae TaxID=3077233 RepID=A0AAJ2JZB2_9BACL|nr:hypothetical protein [Paenibacillus sp. chi10]
MHFYINSFSYDLNHRKSILHNVIKLLVGCFLLVITLLYEVEVLAYRPSILVNKDVIPFIFLISFSFIIILVLSHSKVSPLLMIFASTFFGLMILLISLMVLLLFIASLFTLSLKSLKTGAPLFAVSEIQDIIDNLIKIGIGLIFIASDRTYFIWNLLISVLIQVLIIFITPPYLLKRSKNALTFVNYIFNALILLLLFVSQDVINGINSSIKSFHSIGIEELLNQTNNHTFKELFDKFINVTLIPYIIGSFIGLLLLDRKETALQQKARNNYLTALHLHSNENIKDVIIHLKKSVYYGGESYELLIRSNNGFVTYYNSLLTNEPINSSWGQRFTSTVSSRILLAAKIVAEFSKSVTSKITKLPIVLRQFADNYNLRIQLTLLSIAFSGFAAFALLDFILMNYEINKIFRFLKILFNSLSIAFTTMFIIATVSHLYYRKSFHIVVFYFIASFFSIFILTVEYFLIKLFIRSIVQ